jgi:DNA transformation protein and related proteins
VAVSDDFRDFVLEQLRSAGQVSARPMFGGVGLYLDGLFFALIDDDTLYFKAGDSNRPRYERAGSKPFCPYPDRPDQAMGYWEVPAEVLEDADELAVWARESMAVALEARKRRPARRRPPRSRGTRGRR